MSRIRLAAYGLLFSGAVASIAVGQSGWQRLPINIPPASRVVGTAFSVGGAGDLVTAHLGVSSRYGPNPVVVTEYLSGSWQPSWATSGVVQADGRYNQNISYLHGYWDASRQVAVVAVHEYNGGNSPELRLWEWTPGQPQTVTYVSVSHGLSQILDLGVSGAFYDDLRGVGLILLASGGVVEYSGGGAFVWVDPSVRPFAPASYPSLNSSCYDPARRRIWAIPRGESLLWEYDVDVGDWISARPLPSSIARREGCAMGYDNVSQGVVLFGGWTDPYMPSASLHGDTWQFDGAVFSRISGSAGPVPRALATFTWDPGASRLLLVGGSNRPPGDPLALGDVWEYRFAISGAGFSTSGAGCVGSAGSPTLAVTPQQFPVAGQPFSVMVQNVPLFAPVFMMLGASDQMWGGTSLPISLGPFGAVGCSMLTGPDLVYGAPNVLGTALWTVTIPSSLGGSTFFNQAVVFDPRANPAGLTVSNLGRVLVGY